MKDKIVVEFDRREIELLSEWLAVIASESRDRTEDHRLMKKIMKAANDD